MNTAFVIFLGVWLWLTIGMVTVALIPRTTDKHSTARPLVILLGPITLAIIIAILPLYILYESIKTDWVERQEGRRR